MFLQLAATIVGLLLTIVASLWGINGLQSDYGVALDGYSNLRDVFEAGSHLATARTLLTQPVPDRDGALREARRAAEMFGVMDSAAQATPGVLELPIEGEAKGAIDSAVDQLASQEVGEEDVAGIQQALGRVGDLASSIRRRIQASQEAAQAKRHATLLAMLYVSALVVIGTLLLGIWQYRGVMLPLSRLSVGVKRVARGRFSQRVDVGGKDEFALLAGDFNRMAEELDELYQNLERKVEEKSRELVRSERLASVGYLAAGVAHEINNPLGIISGYAEMSLEGLNELAARQTGGSAGGGEELARSLGVIRDEAFRCKQIITKLLSLSRAGDEARSEVDLAAVVGQVIGMIGGLPDYRQRKIDFDAPRDKVRSVKANEVEMKQVILNLLINALEASPADGTVRVELSGDDLVVRLRVSDHGKGMAPETAQRVFEPFFTDKKGAGHSGTGLGLSITHVIVTSHGGRIWAESAGPGQGSQFSVELPAIAAAAGGAS
jgi:signal transduction histidine kinase